MWVGQDYPCILHGAERRKSSIFDPDPPLLSQGISRKNSPTRSRGFFCGRSKVCDVWIKNNYKFTISERSRDNLVQMKEDNCNIISFLNDEQLIRFGAGLECSTADLYSAYCYTDKILRKRTGA